MSKATPANRELQSHGLLVVAIMVGLGVALWLLARTWLNWVDPLIDVDREIYAAWRVSQGARLYQDVAYFNGPFSPWWNAAWFRAFGVGVHTILWVNAAVALGILAMVYTLVSWWRRDKVLAGFVTVTCLLLFVYTLRTAYGGYTFLAPYSHELPHGLALALLMMVAIAKNVDSMRLPWVFVAGAAYGTSLLTKPEVGVATSLIAAVGLVLVDGDARHRMRIFLAFLVAALVPVFAAVLFLASDATVGNAIWEVLTPYRMAALPELRDLPYYRWVAGTLNISDSLKDIGLWAAIHGLYVAVLILLGLWSMHRGISRLSHPALQMVLLALAATAVVAARFMTGSTGFLRPLPLLVLGCFPLLLRDRRLHSRATNRSFAVGVLLVVAGLVFMLKIRFNVTIQQYGFVLAVLGVVVWVVLVVDLLPRLFAPDDGRSTAASAWGTGLVLGMILIHTLPVLRLADIRSFEVGEGSDRFRTDPVRGQLVSDVVERLKVVSKPSDRIAVVPEGTMINYLLRQPSSVPYLVYLTPEELMFGSAAMVAEFDRNPPDWIVWWDRNYPLLGRFGDDFGVELGSWIVDGYEPSWAVEIPGGLANGLPQEVYSARILRRRGTADR